jgi:DNA-binding NtrC family response regulator
MGVWRMLEVEGSEPTIYVVDDDEAVRDSQKLVLETHSMVVEDYQSSEEYAQSYMPGRGACLILDFHLSGASGLDYLGKQDDAAAELPLIIIKGRGDLASRARAEQRGSKAHNIALRQIAAARGLKVNEHGLFGRHAPGRRTDRKRDIPVSRPALHRARTARRPR